MIGQIGFFSSSTSFLRFLVFRKFGSTSCGCNDKKKPYHSIVITKIKLIDNYRISFENFQFLLEFPERIILCTRGE